MRTGIKKLISLLLVLALAAGLAACGKGGDKPADGDEQQGENGGLVWAADFKEIVTGDDYGSIRTRFATDEGMYATIYEKVGEEIPEGVTPEYEGQYDVYAHFIYLMGFDGSLKKLENYEPIPKTENAGGYKEFYCNNSISALLEGPDDTILCLEQCYTSYWDGPEGMGMDDEDYYAYYNYNQEYYIRSLDKTGAELSRNRIETEQGQYLYLYNVATDEAGNIVMPGDMCLMAVALDGSIAYKIDCDSYPDGVFKLNDGRVTALTWGDNGYEAVVIDTGSRSLGERLELPEGCYQPQRGTGDYDIVYTNGASLYGYTFATGANECIFNWVNLDVNSDELEGMFFLEDGSVAGVTNHWDSSGENRTTELVRVSLKPYDPSMERRELTIAVQYLSWDTRQAIINFNRHSDSYRLVVRDYSEYNTEEDYNAGMTKLTTEIMAGNMPDILYMDGDMPYTQLAAKGLLEDLYPYIDADPEMSRGDFFENVLKGLEVDGKLCQVAGGFYILSAAGASSVVGDEPGWSYDEFNAALASMPEGCTPFDMYVTRDTILQYCMYLDMNHYVDWTTGQVYFDSPEFVKLLEFANQFPAEFDWENYEWSEEDSTQQRIAQGRQMLIQCTIYDPNDIIYNDYYFGGECSYVGYPCSSGVGNMINIISGYAMSAACSDKEGAWQFIRTTLTEENRNSMYGLPLRKSAFNSKLEAAMTPEYITDEQGNYILDEDGNKIEQIQGTIGNGDGTTYNIYALNQQQADRLMAVITGSDRVLNGNPAILEIIKEQAEAYFAGQKSAEEVARLIQSKANIYVNEQR